MKKLALLIAAILVVVGLAKTEPTISVRNSDYVTLPPTKVTQPIQSMPDEKPVIVSNGTKSQDPAPPPIVQPNVQISIPSLQPEKTLPASPVRESEPPSKIGSAWVREVEEQLRKTETPTIPYPAGPTFPSETETGKTPVIEVEDLPEIGTPIETRPPFEEALLTRKQFVVDTKQLNVRATGSAIALKVGELHTGEIVEFEGTEIAGWVKIRARNATLEGWVKKLYLVETENDGLY